MTTRRRFVQSFPAFAVAANVLEGDAATAAPAAAASAVGHFHPKGKPPSEFTKAVLRKARQRCRSATPAISTSNGGA